MPYSYPMRTPIETVMNLYVNSRQVKTIRNFATISLDDLGGGVQILLHDNFIALHEIYPHADGTFDAPSELVCLFLLFDSRNADAVSRAQTVAKLAKQQQIICLAVAAFPEIASTKCDYFDGIIPIFVKNNEEDFLALNMAKSIINLIEICCAGDCLISLDFNDVISCLQYGSYIQSISFCETGSNANEQIFNTFSEANEHGKIWENYKGYLILFTAPNAQLKKRKVSIAMDIVAIRCADQALVKHGVQYKNTDAYTIRVLAFYS